MAKKIASKQARAKQAKPKKKAKKQRPSRPAKGTKAKPPKPKRRKKIPPRAQAAKRFTAARATRKAAKASAAAIPSPSVAVAPTSPSAETRAGLPPPPAGTTINTIQEGLACIDQQRVVNNLDRGTLGEAPTPTGHTHEPTNARFVAHHAAQLEDELDRGEAAIKALEGHNLQRRLMWDLGLARTPRAVVVGRALFELRATSWEDASRGENYAIVNHINTRGPHHLSKTIANLLRSYDSKASTAAAAALAPLLRRALELLQSYSWLEARTRGVYLVGDGLTLFVDFPDWNWRDEKPPKLRRIRRHGKPPSSA